MSLLNQVDKAGSDVERFVVDLDKILAKKMKMIGELRSKLSNFYVNLKTEAQMSLLYQEQQERQNEILEAQASSHRPKSTRNQLKPQQFGFSDMSQENVDDLLGEEQDINEADLDLLF